MGYSNDQFYNIGSAGESQGRLFSENNTGRPRNTFYHPDADNPRFVYPDREIRTYSKDTNEFGRERLDRTILKRGFVRSLSRSAGDNVSKCQFQFNPQTLTQEVTMSDTLLNWYAQDPAQFAQPLAGNTQMSFTLLFDRSMEINNPTRSRDSSNVSASPWEYNSPSEVGVLRDIAVLYSVIGQGVTAADVDSRLDDVRTSIKAEFIELGEDGDREQYSKAINNIQDSMNANLGNYSLLIPRPIRFVFSSLYMVEGSVTSSVVSFQKFNSSYVPIQALVSLTVEAQHIGFAKKKTFTTYNIEQTQLANDAYEKEQQQVLKDSYDKVKEALGAWVLELDTVPLAFNDPPDMQQLQAGYGGTNNDLVLRALAANGGADRVLELFRDGGASVEVKAKVEAFIDLSYPGVPTGRENTAPVLSISLSRKLSTAEEFKDYDGELLGDAVTPPPPFTPLETYGGNWRLNWSVEVIIKHKGVTLTGRTPVVTRNKPPTLEEWSAHIQDVFLVGWSFEGEPATGKAPIPTASVNSTSPGIPAPDSSPAPPTYPTAYTFY